MSVVGFVPKGFDGEIVTVEVDIRRGIPGTDVVGLAGGAVREARERVRAAIRNSGLRYPADRVLVNLAPAGVRKTGASFDLSIALAVLAAFRELPDILAAADFRAMVLGELQLDGNVRPVTGVLSAVAVGLENDVGWFIVPAENCAEAQSLAGRRVTAITTLAHAAHEIYLTLGAQDGRRGRGDLRGKLCNEAGRWQSGNSARAEVETAYVDVADLTPACGNPPSEPALDYSALRNQRVLTRAMEIVAAGGHSALVFGPPGSGKTMAVRRLPSILPSLSREESIEVTRIYSLAGILPPRSGLVRERPFRAPHHSASLEGMVGGGRVARPGELSLAHRGVLFLDETHEFRTNVLQSLREPLEDGQVSLARAEGSLWYPSRVQLVLAANPCPCGNLGRRDAICLCSDVQRHLYWKRIGGALLDRIDIRVPVLPSPADRLVDGPGESSIDIGKRVARAIAAQEVRYYGFACSRNGELPGASVFEHCRMTSPVRRSFVDAVRHLHLSSRSVVSILRLSRTIADLDGSDGISEEHIFEAVQFRRYSGPDFEWSAFQD